MFKVMDAITVAFQEFDLVVQSFVGPVGSAILPAVLDVGAVVPDGVGAPPGALMAGGGISVKPVGEYNLLYRLASPPWRGAGLGETRRTYRSEHQKTEKLLKTGGLSKNTTRLRSFCTTPQNKEELLKKSVNHKKTEKNHQLFQKNSKN